MDPLSATIWDYLGMVNVELKGISSPLVMRIAPNQPNVLGLDAVFRFGIVIDPVKGSYMSRMGITDEDLIPVDDLPDPNVAYYNLLKAGNANAAIHLL
ncbi:hypothetical protein ROZALSC1DRAFT_26562 [Rozella allomycis CSF55]|uniref:Uncharacterized protein n=1 Tax=Rozella allomycis (strain CSF55) TaxID=988480 RepID=A0A075B1J8_ROZAC|nr:hypothetical protein O9G_002976 [Rozella allomycis CSF55]RKP22049.1 hypothetical protein ROZALSC1DRAFT_26562 [Rozella allomycis CSF55]|eukprot:EPZ34658.1 hypothetical protein O9G_002976 [Rozella allomycis CSF55]